MKTFKFFLVSASLLALNLQAGYAMTSDDTADPADAPSAAHVKQHPEEEAYQIGMRGLKEKCFWETSWALKLAAKADHPLALRTYGELYANGTAGLSVKPAKSFSFYQRAADLGDTESQYQVGAKCVEEMKAGRHVFNTYQLKQTMAWKYLKMASDSNYMPARKLIMELAGRATIMDAHDSVSPENGL